MRRLHYAWVVVGVTFFTMFATAGVRAAPGVLILPLEGEFAWSRSSISLAVAVSILAFGLGAPIAGSLVDRFGPRLVMLGSVALVAIGLLPLLAMRELWQFFLLWGVVVGVGTGGVANVLGATVAHRWFYTHRGLIVGLFGAASSAGQLVFLPSMMAVAREAGWRGALALLAAVALLLLIPIALLMRDRPEQVALRAVGDTGSASAAEVAQDSRRTSLRDALRTRDYWLLASSFFVCGYTSNGLVGTHLIPHAIEHGFTELTAASAVGLMGVMNVVGTLASGWLSDRFDNRKLLAAYYGFRALSIAALPFILDVQWLMVFAVVYGLDWIATVPPTTNLTAKLYGRASLGTLFGWIFFAHMLGAALAAYAGGFFHDLLGDYHLMFLSAALLGFIAVALSLRITPTPARARVAPLAASPLA